MSNYRRTKTKGGTYFFTVVTYRRQRFLCNENVRNALREGVNETRTTYPFTINGWVLLLDHLHCIWTLPPDDPNNGIRWGSIKQKVTELCGTELQRDDWMTPSKIKRKESTLWQRRFWEHEIRDDLDYERHMDYIHYNPVKHGLVNKVADWPHSTFHRYVRDGVYGLDWAGVVDDIGLGGFGEPRG